MVRMRDIVQQALASGYLTITAEDQLRAALRGKMFDADDLTAFWHLQQAAMNGAVKQESHGWGMSS